MSPTVKGLHVFDDAKFRAATPFPLHPTNLPGAYTTPAPADDFDPNTASPGDLVRAGLLWKRPDAASQPQLREAWDRVMSRKWRPEDRIVPKLEVQRGRTHHLRQTQTNSLDGSNQPTTWWAGAGVLAQPGSSWSGVIGFWEVPSVSMPPEPAGPNGGWDSSSWIGIDGWQTSNDVLQAGIDQNVDAQGNAHYDAWYRVVRHAACRGQLATRNAGRQPGLSARLGRTRRQRPVHLHGHHRELSCQRRRPDLLLSPGTTTTGRDRS